MINSSSVIELNSNGGVLSSIKKPDVKGGQRNLHHIATQKEFVGRQPASPMARGGGSIGRDGSVMKTLGMSDLNMEDAPMMSP